MEGKIKVVRAGCDVETKNVEEVIEEIKKYAVSTGGFRLIEEKEIPKYITITRSSRPGPAFDSKSEDTLITDGDLEFVSEKHTYNYPTLNAHYYKYKLTNATYVVLIQWWGNDYNGGWQEWTTVIIHGNCPFHERIKQLQEELNI
jgi:hypothetical protein